METSEDRLRRAIASARTDLALWKTAYDLSKASGEVAVLEQCLGGAEDSLRQKSIDDGFQQLFAAERSALYLLAKVDPELLAQRAQTLVEEARDKLGSWRRRRILEALLADPEKADAKLKPRLSGPAVADAARLIHERHANVHRSLNLVILAIGVLTLAAFCVLGGWLALDPLRWRDNVKPILLGAMGALASAFSSLAGFDAKRVPEQRAAFVLALGKIALGGLAGAASVKVVESFGELEPFRGFIPFVAGFSERFLAAAVGAVAGKVEKS
jgi:hypothetical protein